MKSKPTQENTPRVFPRRLFLFLEASSLMRARRVNPARAFSESERILMRLVLLILVILLLIGGLPTWEYSRNWGYGPTGGVGLLVVVLVVLMLLGKI